LPDALSVAVVGEASVAVGVLVEAVEGISVAVVAEEEEEEEDDDDDDDDDDGEEEEESDGVLTVASGAPVVSELTVVDDAALLSSTRIRRSAIKSARNITCWNLEVRHSFSGLMTKAKAAKMVRSKRNRKRGR